MLLRNRIQNGGGTLLRINSVVWKTCLNAFILCAIKADFTKRFHATRTRAVPDSPYPFPNGTPYRIVSKWINMAAPIIAVRREQSDSFIVQQGALIPRFVISRERLVETLDSLLREQYLFPNTQVSVIPSYFIFILFNTQLIKGFIAKICTILVCLLRCNSGPLLVKL